MFTFIFLRIIVLPFPKVNKVVCVKVKGLRVCGQGLKGLGLRGWD